VLFLILRPVAEIPRQDPSLPMAGDCVWAMLARRRVLAGVALVLGVCFGCGSSPSLGRIFNYGFPALFLLISFWR
jgi:hypothetical protein